MNPVGHSCIFHDSEEQRKRSTVGLEAEKYMTSGGLVPDEMVVEIVVNAIKAVPAGS